MSAGLKFFFFFFSRKENAMKSGMCAVFVGLLCLLPAKGAVLWSDGFESGNFSAWTSATGAWSVVTSTLSAHSGLKGADIKGLTDPAGDVVLIRVSSSGYQNLEWQFWYKVRDALEVGDSLFAEWTANGTIWSPLAEYTNLPIGDWQSASFALPASANDNPNLALRLRAVLGSATDRMNIDDVSLSGTAVAVPEPSIVIAGMSLVPYLCLRKRR
jgi:hypothetical protein